MSGTIWPVDAVSGAPDYTGRMLREAALAPLAGGATTARPFGGISGVRPGTSKVIGTMSGLTYTVTPFGGLLDGEASTLAGVYGFSFPANETGTIPAQTGTARTGLLSVKLNDPAEGDAGLPSVSLVYTDSLTSPGHGFDLYQVNIPATGGGSPTLTWIGPFTVAAGGIQPVPTTVYPASPYLGQYVDDASLGLLRWNGTAWTPFGPQSSRAELKYTGAGISCANGSNVVVTYDGTDYYNNLSAFTYNRAAGTLVCTRAGTYEFDSDVVWAVTGSTTGIRQLSLYKALAATPTTFVLQSVLTLPAQNTVYKMNATWKVTLAVGDVIEFQAAQNSGAALNVSTANLAVTQMV